MLLWIKFKLEIKLRRYVRIADLKEATEKIPLHDRWSCCYIYVQCWHSKYNHILLEPYMGVSHQYWHFLFPQVVLHHQNYGIIKAYNSRWDVPIGLSWEPCKCRHRNESNKSCRCIITTRSLSRKRSLLQKEPVKVSQAIRRVLLSGADAGRATEVRRWVYNDIERWRRN